MPVEGVSSNHSMPEPMAMPAESAKVETKSIGGMPVATSLNGVKSAPHPVATADMGQQIAGEKVINQMLVSVSQVNMEALQAVASDQIKNTEIKGDAKLNALANEETAKDRRADRNALKEELNDRKDTDRVNAEENRSKMGS
ncbi:hypothetical protein [Estrella lausannensis]|uniref:Uncharacterized protein n=1 Tax=Estrella lausannensis TaxID=483423 RepID=A0A0H5DN72_9BACT|nr:hypothetical protein [Estrella lausannensis]CRX37711.1 hypothetical protein ELAC_0350 [Estrella lausannensis]